MSLIEKEEILKKNSVICPNTDEEYKIRIKEYEKFIIDIENYYHVKYSPNELMPVWAICKIGDIYALKYILDNSIIKNMILKYQRAYGEITTAIEYGNLEIVKYMLSMF